MERAGFSENFSSTGPKRVPVPLLEIRRDPGGINFTTSTVNAHRRVGFTRLAIRDFDCPFCAGNSLSTIYANTGKNAMQEGQR